MSPRPNLNKSYQQLVIEGRIQNDAAQQKLLSLLQEVLDNLLAPQKKSFFKKVKPVGKAKSLYIYGNVGRGKSMLMDLFFAGVPEHHKHIKKRRVHFHAFMQEVHSRIHKLRQEKADDPVAVLASEIAKETQLLCFDELQATDVADATLLYRLFEGLFVCGVCVVSTSNRPPAALYTGGVQAERFIEFIRLIEEKMTVAALSSPDDYRYQQGRNQMEYYCYPLGYDADDFVAKTLKKLGVKENYHTETLIVHGRQIAFKAYNKKIGYFTFNELCAEMLGAADYLALARRLDVVIITNIPKLKLEQRNEAKRFVTLIDTLYEHKVRLICTAEVTVEEVYEEGDGAFEFKRTVSRLVEMQSENYGKTINCHPEHSEGSLQKIT